MSKSLLLKLQFSFPINKHGSNTYRLLKVTVCTGHCHLWIELVSRNTLTVPLTLFLTKQYLTLQLLLKETILNPTKPYSLTNESLTNKDFSLKMELSLNKSVNRYSDLFEKTTKSLFS